MATNPAVRFLDRTTPPHVMTLVLIAGLSAMSLNVFLPSLPHMADHFATDYSVMQLSVAVYLAVNAVLQIIVGPISDRYGRRPVLLVSTVLFVAATIGCIYAPTIEVFLIFRMGQAVIVSGMVLSRAVVRDMYDQDKAASMIGYVAMGMAVVPMISPAVGGFLDEVFGWESNFWLLAILGVLTAWLIWADLGETAARRNTSLMDQVREYPGLLTSRRFWGYCLAMAFAAGAFFAYLGGAPFVGSEVFGMTPAELGFFFGAPAIGYFAGNFVSGRYSARIGVNRMVFVGSLINATGITLSMLVFWLGYGTQWSFFGFMTFVGLGNGMIIPNATAGMLSVRPHLAGTASGLGGSIMLGGGAGLSALAGVLLVPGSGPWPLLWIMWLTAIGAIIAIRFVIWRAAQLGGLDTA